MDRPFLFHPTYAHCRPGQRLEIFGVAWRVTRVVTGSFARTEVRRWRWYDDAAQAVIRAARWLFPLPEKS